MSSIIDDIVIKILSKSVIVDTRPVFATENSTYGLINSVWIEVGGRVWFTLKKRPVFGSLFTEFKIFQGVRIMYLVWLVAAIKPRLPGYYKKSFSNST